MKEMSRNLLGVVTQSLWGGSPAQHPIFNLPIECTWAVLEFYMYAQYKSHDDATLSYMEDALCRYHTFKDVFSLRRSGKQAKAWATAPTTAPMKMRKVDEETNAEIWMLSKKRRKMNAWRDYISHQMDFSNELDADVNFPKINLMFDWVEQIRRYGSLQHYTAERLEQAQKTNLKDGWNASNHTVNCLPQVITFQHRILCFEIRDVNLQAIAEHRENSAAACKVLPSGADLAAPLSPVLDAMLNSMGPQHCRDETHPDTMIKDFRALLDNTQYATHHVAI